jgi:hypothetical protein
MKGFLFFLKHPLHGLRVRFPDSSFRLALEEIKKGVPFTDSKFYKRCIVMKECPKCALDIQEYGSKIVLELGEQNRF